MSQSPVNSLLPEIPAPSSPCSQLCARPRCSAHYPRASPPSKVAFRKHEAGLYDHRDFGAPLADCVFCFFRQPAGAALPFRNAITCAPVPCPQIAIASFRHLSITQLIYPELTPRTDVDMRLQFSLHIAVFPAHCIIQSRNTRGCAVH